MFSETNIFCLFDTKLVLFPYFIRQNENQNLATCSSEFELKLLFPLGKLLGKLSEHCTATLQSSHKKNIRFDCK